MGLQDGVRRRWWPRIPEHLRLRGAHEWFLLAMVVVYSIASGCLLLLILTHLTNERVQTAEIRKLPLRSIREVTVFDQEGQQKLEEISQPAALRDLVVALRDARVYWPDHPNYVASWYLVLKTQAGRIELECHYEAEHPHQVMCSFVHKEGLSTWYRGDFISTGLRPWFEQNVER